MKPFRQGQKEWEKSVVQRRIDERSYEVDAPQGTYRCNRVHLRRTRETETTVPLVPVLSHDLQRYAAVPVPPKTTTMNETAIDSVPATDDQQTEEKTRASGGLCSQVIVM